MYFGFNMTFLPQFFAGYFGMPRRYHTYPPEFQIYNVMSSSGAAVLAVAYLLPLGYFAWSLYYGKRAGNNPWDATGLEWTTSRLRRPRISIANLASIAALTTTMPRDNRRASICRSPERTRRPMTETTGLLQETWEHFERSATRARSEFGCFWPVKCCSSAR